MEAFLKLIKKTKSLTILFVEDSDIVRMSSIKLFEEIFDEVLVGVDGKEGFDIYLEHADEIDAIITDINMPVMNGLEMAELIRKDNKDIPILLLTGNDYKDIDNNIVNLNIQGILAKPIVISDFIDTFNKIV